MLSIIVLSSDGYSDCWIPFFKFFKNNFPNLDEYEVILSTNTKDFTYDGLEIKVLKNGAETPWSKRLKMSIKEAAHDLVFVLAEDMVLRSPMDKKLFEQYLSQIRDNKEIDHIRMLSTFDRTMVKKSPFEGLDEIEDKTKLRFLYLPAIWKKKVLMKYVVNYETPYMSERIGDYRSWIYKHGFYCVSKDYVDKNGEFYDSRQSGVLFKGKWANTVPALFEAHNIEVDFSKRGFVTPEFAKQSRIDSKRAVLMSPFSTLRSFLSVGLLYIKVKIFRSR